MFPCCAGGKLCVTRSRDEDVLLKSVQPTRLPRRRISFDLPMSTTNALISSWFQPRRYVLGLIFAEVAALQLGVWLEWRSIGSDDVRRSSFDETYLEPFFWILLLIFVLIMLIVGSVAWWAIKRENPAGAGVEWPLGTWTMLMVCWFATLLILPLPGWLIVMSWGTRGLENVIVREGLTKSRNDGVTRSLPS